MFKFVALVLLVGSANAGLVNLGAPLGAQAFTAPALQPLALQTISAPIQTVAPAVAAVRTISAPAPVVQTVAAPSVSIASGPALAPTLLGRTTVTAPETTIVKQPIVVDQPEVRFRAVPTVVQTAPVVQQVAAVRAIAPAVQTVVAAPVAIQAPAQTVIEAPAFRTWQAAPVQYAALQYSSYPVAHASPAWNAWNGAPILANQWAPTLLGSPASTLLTLKK